MPYLGANADCKAGSLVQFAQMGHVYMKKVLGITNPRVGLLSTGEEDNKGNQMVQEAHRLLRKADLNFIGNVESKDMTSGTVDILVTDGFTGNLILKMGEGLGEMVLNSLKKESSRRFYLRLAYRLLKPSIHSVISQLDYTEYGGAFLLGVKGNVVIAHGRSDAKAIKNAVHVAKRMVEHNVVQALSDNIQPKKAGGFPFGLHKPPVQTMVKKDGEHQGEGHEPTDSGNRQ